MPQISVIIPVYNMARHLENCLASIGAQSFDDIEILAVDDGSTDQSPALLDRLAQSEPRLHVIRKENGGVSSARNAGILAARGKYLYFADSDDVLTEGALAALYARAEETGCGFVYGGFDSVTPGGEVIEPYEARYRYLEGGAEQVHQFFCNAFVPRMGTFLVRADTAAGLAFPEGYRYGEDRYFITMCILRAGGFRAVNRVVYRYVQTGDSAMSRAATDRFHHVDLLIKALDELEKDAALSAASTFLRYKIIPSTIILLCGLLMAAGVSPREIMALVKEKGYAARVLAGPEDGALRRLQLALWHASPWAYAAVCRALRIPGRLVSEVKKRLGKRA